MFTFPVTIPYRDEAGVYPFDVNVNIDDVLKVVSLSTINDYPVESDDLYSCVPATEIVFTDGRKLPVLETAAIINRYLDAYRQIEDFYTTVPSRRTVTEKSQEGVVVSLFGTRTVCDSSQAPTPA